MILTWKRRASKQLEKIDVKFQGAILEKVGELITFPQCNLDITKLTDSDKYRLRVGNYRIIFEVIGGDPKVCSIEEVLRRNSKTY